MKRQLVTLLICSANLLLVAAADTVAGWRGNQTGRFPGAAPATPWDAAENIIWKTATPEWSNAGPVIAGDRIFICAEPDILLCVDKATGNILWQHANNYADITPPELRGELTVKLEQAAKLQNELNALRRDLRRLRQQVREEPDNPELQPALDQLLAREKEQLAVIEPLEYYRMPRTHRANGYSSATPVTDGVNVYVYFATGVAAAYDTDGNRLWARIIEKPVNEWGHSSSPVLAGGRFIIHVRDVHGLDPATGATLWTAKSAPRWGAAVTAEIDGHPVVLTANGELIRAEDGLILADGLHRLDYCAPLVHDGIVYYIENGGKAYRLPARADGTQQPELLWQTDPPKDRYYASPLYHAGHIYCIHQKGLYSVIDARTGAVLKSSEIKGLRRTVYTSVTLAGSLILLGSEGGNIVMLEPGLDMRPVSAAAFETFRSTPVFEGQRAYLRTTEALYCIGRP